MAVGLERNLGRVEAGGRNCHGIVERAVLLDRILRGGDRVSAQMKRREHRICRKPATQRPRRRRKR